jgi:hypothetical protein
LIYSAVIGIIVVFVVAGYVLTRPSGLDAYDGRAVSSAHLQALQQASTIYGPSGSSMAGSVQASNGQPFMSNGKPVFVYVGEDGCPYCATQRWAMVLALLRFGTFTNLNYMTSSLDGTDFPTFTFHGSSYQSDYLVFRPYEINDRAGGALDALPTNVSAVFASQGNNAFPYLSFANKYYVSGALLPSGSNTVNALLNLFGGKNWTQVISGINGYSGDQLGTALRESANLITSTICKVLPSPPSGVCQQTSISALAAFHQASSSAFAVSSLGIKGKPLSPVPSKTREL